MPTPICCLVCLVMVCVKTDCTIGCNSEFCTDSRRRSAPPSPAVARSELEARVRKTRVPIAVAIPVEEGS